MLIFLLIFMLQQTRKITTCEKRSLKQLLNTKFFIYPKNIIQNPIFYLLSIFYKLSFKKVQFNVFISPFNPIKTDLSFK